MKTLILTGSPDAYSTNRLVEEIAFRGDESEVINPFDLYAFISSTTSGHDRIYKRGEEKAERIKNKTFDAIIPRIAGANFDHGVMIVKQLTANMHIFSTAYERGLKISSNKFLTSQVLSAAKIRNPKQILAYRPTDYKELINLVGGLPVVGKLQHGSLGAGVFLLNDPVSASTSLESFRTLGANVILQQYIDSGEPKTDLRIIVIGPETKEPKLFAYKRYALDSDFRSNWTISGIGETVELTEEEKQMAIDAALAVGLGVCGVDIIRAQSENKPYIIEVNGSPGLKGIETVTGENIAGAIVDYIKDNYKKGKSTNTKTNAASPGISKPRAASQGNNKKSNSVQKSKNMTIMNRIRGAFGQRTVTEDDFGKLSAKEYSRLDDAQKLFYDAGTAEKRDEIKSKVITKAEYEKLDPRQKFLVDVERMENEDDWGTLTDAEIKGLDDRQRFLYQADQMEKEEDWKELSNEEYEKLDPMQKFMYDLDKATETLKHLPRIEKKY